MVIPSASWIRCTEADATAFTGVALSVAAQADPVGCTEESDAGGVTAVVGSPDEATDVSDDVAAVGSGADGVASGDVLLPQAAATRDATTIHASVLRIPLMRSPPHRSGLNASCTSHLHRTRNADEGGEIGGYHGRPNQPGWRNW